LFKKLKDKLVNKFTGKEDKPEIVQEIQNKINTWIDDTRTIRRQWLINSAFARSQQWCILRDTEDQLVNLAAPPGRKQITDDMIKPAKKHFIANMIVATPRFKAIPENLMNSDAISAARVGSALLSHFWDSWKFILDYIQLLSYTFDFGNCYIYINVEPVQTSFSAIDAITGDTAKDESGNAIIGQDTIMDITETVLPPQSLICPLDTLPISKKPWLIIYQNKTLDYFKETYENGDEVTAETDNVRDQYNLSSISRLDSKRYQRSAGADCANEYIYMQMPSDRNPEGMICCGAGDVLLIPKDKKEAIQPWPYKKLTTYPIIHFHDLRESGEFLARASIEQVIPLQKSLNLIWSSLIENAEDMCHIKWLVHTTARLNDEDINDMPDIVHWNGIHEPTQKSPAALPQYVFMIIDYLKRAIRDKQSFHEISSGGTAGSVRSEVHASNLQEQDLLPMSIDDETFAAKFEEMGEIILKIAAEKLDDERLITYTGDDRRIMIEKFRGELLGNTQKVKVKLTNMHLRNRNAVIQNIISMFQYGMIIDGFGRPDGMRAMELLEWAVPDSEFDDMKLHSERAHLENDKLMAGEFMPVLPQQNHKIDLNIHHRYMNSPEFMKLYEGAEFDRKQGKIIYKEPENEEIVNNFTEHTAVHLNAYMQALAMLQPPPEKQGEQTKTKQKPKAKS